MKYNHLLKWIENLNGQSFFSLKKIIGSLVCGLFRKLVTNKARLEICMMLQQCWTTLCTLTVWNKFDGYTHSGWSALCPSCGELKYHFVCPPPCLTFCTLKQSRMLSLCGSQSPLFKWRLAQNASDHISPYCLTGKNQIWIKLILLFFFYLKNARLPFKLVTPSRSTAAFDIKQPAALYLTRYLVVEADPPTQWEPSSSMSCPNRTSPSLLQSLFSPSSLWPSLAAASIFIFIYFYDIFVVFKRLLFIWICVKFLFFISDLIFVLFCQAEICVGF